MNFKERLVKYESAQFSGKIYMKHIPQLKEKHYYILPIPLDGEAPKQYIKAYFYYENCPRASKPSTWDGYFAKSGKKSYPHESVMEFVINKIGEYLGMKMNETRLVIANEQVRFLSKDFIEKGKRLIHGIEILVEYFEDKQFVEDINNNKKDRRYYFTFEEVENAISYVYPDIKEKLLSDLIKLITYDAIVGNSDRHFYNWGVIGNSILIEGEEVVFSPIYDSARALLWNSTEEAIEKMYQQFRNGYPALDYYIMRSKPGISCESNYNANHFELITFLSSYRDNYKTIISQLITEEKETYILEMLKRNVYCFFSKKRCILIDEILKKRFSKLREAIL